MAAYLGIRTLEHLKARGKFETDPEQEGWLVSYADLITLLFIFFSVMLSISVVSKTKFDLLSHELNHQTVSQLAQFKQRLDQELQKQGLQKEVQTDMTDEGLQVQFSERVLFGLGDSAMSAEGSQVLIKFAKVLLGSDGHFNLAVEGHTDNRPIHTPSFPSNWELSAGRAVNVLHFLASQGMSEKRMMVRAYADTKSIGTDDAKNRRVNLLVF